MSKSPAVRRRKREKPTVLSLPYGEWLTGLNCRPCLVIRHVKGRDIGRPKPGKQLTAELAYRDSGGNIHILEAGYVWDMSSYPDLLEWLVGVKRLAALLAASAMHDAHGPKYKVLKMTENGHQLVEANYSIRKSAWLYLEMIRSWPEKDERINALQRAKQFLGLLIFQRAFRLFSGGKHATWRLYEGN